MSLIPIFKVGLWNAWIFMVLLVFPSLTVPRLVNKEKWHKWAEGDPLWNEMNKDEKTVFVITHMIIMPFTLIYSIFLPLKLGTWWFIAGLPIFIIALLMELLFITSFLTAPLGKPNTTGIYAFSRNPGYLSFFLGCVSIGIACSSWIFLLCAIAWIVAWNFGVVNEERVLIKKYGDDYKEYMERTPRWLGMPKAKV